MIKIIADTTSVIDPAQAEKLEIAMIPQIIVIGDKSYRDDNEITTEEFLVKLKSSPVLPKTAAPPPALYTPIYERIVSNKDTALVICPSADVSGTVRSATVAAQEFPGADIRIIDTRTIGPALGTLVLKANEWAKSGLSEDAIIARLTKASRCNKIYFYVDTLDYLYKGGRIGGASALVGSILQVKPILSFQSGQVKQFDKQQTKRRAFARIIEVVKSECPNSEKSHLTIFQGDGMQSAEEIRSQLSTIMTNIKEIPITRIPPAIIVHAGPGVVAVSFFTDFPD